MVEDDFEIKEPDEYSHKAGETFSHSQLVMLAMRKCIEAGCQEMRNGYRNEKRDKFGNIIKTYIPDTRKVFTESVETCKMVMADDIDEEAQTKIKAIETWLEQKYLYYCKKEEQDWIEAKYPQIMDWGKLGIVLRKGFLHENFPYHVCYSMDKVIAARKIFAELKKLTQRKDYYREEEYHA